MIWQPHPMTAVPSRSELIAALNDPDPNNPLSGAIAHAIERYTAALSEQTQRAGQFLETLVLRPPDTEIEAFALEVFLEQIAQMGIRVVLRGQH